MKLEDIARIANVSKSAASIALNGKPGVSEETRKYILKIAEEYHYVPLRKHVKKEEQETKLKIRFVACINEDVIPENYQQLPFFNELLSFISTEASQQQHLLVTNSLPKDDLLNHLKKLEEEDASDGIIVLGTSLTSAHILPLAKSFDNLVILDTQSSNTNCTTVTMNNYLGAYEATRYLLEMGHEQIGYIKGIPRINNFYDRRRGFKDALLKNELNPNDLPKFYLPGMQIKVIEKNLEQFLDFAKKVTAIFCEDDYIAISVIKTLNKYGIQVPKDVSVIGFDDISESRVITPELTTIHVPIKEIAQEAIQLIEKNARNSYSIVNKQVFLNTQLIPRDSVKKLS